MKPTKRREIVTTDAGIELPAKPSRAKRDRSYERAHPVTAYRGIPPALNAEINRIAQDLHVPAGDVARAFLQAGLDLFNAGRLDLQPCVKTGKFTLFPDSE